MSVSSRLGLGKMSNSVEKDWYNLNTDIQTTASLTSTFELNYRYIINYFFIQSGLSFSKINGNQKESTLISTSSMNTESSISEKRLGSYYIGIPVSANIRWKKLEIGAGVKINLHLANSYDVKIYSTSPNVPLNGVIQGIVFSGKHNMSKIDFGIIGRLSYDLNDKFALEFGGYYGLVDASNNFDKGILYDIFQEPVLAESRIMKNMQLTAGLRFLIAGGQLK